MSEIKFITFHEVLKIHQFQIDRYGGSPGVRDYGLLESAINNMAYYDNIFDIGAAYMFNIIKNHPFIDGNKRTGVAVALIFLDSNGATCTIDPITLAHCAIDTANSELSIEDLSRIFFCSHNIII
jgi:death-on-curing protein